MARLDDLLGNRNGFVNPFCESLEVNMQLILDRLQAFRGRRILTELGAEIVRAAVIITIIFGLLGLYALSVGR